MRHSAPNLFGRARAAVKKSVVALCIRNIKVPTPGFLPEDADLAIGMHYGVDPYVVDHVWPEELRYRALTQMAAEGEAHALRSKRQAQRDKANEIKDATPVKFG